MKQSNDQSAIPCNDCQAGQMHRRLVTYFTWLGDELITVPDFPAWVCDVCGKREYDPYALNQLTLLLNPSAGKSVTRHRKIQPQQPTKKSQRPSQP